MYGGVNLSRHAKSKREVSKEDMCQRDAEYARNKILISKYRFDELYILVSFKDYRVKLRKCCDD